MGAKTSEEMRNAQLLLWSGIKPAEASRQTGISPSAISHSDICQEIIRVVGLARERLRSEIESSDTDLMQYFTGPLSIPEHHARALLAGRQRQQRQQPGRAKEGV
jgi:hypothetical protein